MNLHFHYYWEGGQPNIYVFPNMATVLGICCCLSGGVCIIVEALQGGRKKKKSYMTVGGRRGIHRNL